MNKCEHFESEEKAKTVYEFIKNNITKNVSYYINNVFVEEIWTVNWRE